MGARGKREAFSKRLWKTPLHVCTCSQPFPKRLSRPEFPAFSTIAAASIGHALQHKSDPPKRQENRFFYFAIQGGGLHYLWIWPGLSFLAVACAYFGLGPRVFGKRSDGTIASLALLALLPYFLFTWGIWHLHGSLSKKTATTAWCRASTWAAVLWLTSCLGTLTPWST